MVSFIVMIVSCRRKTKNRQQPAWKASLAHYTLTAILTAIAGVKGLQQAIHPNNANGHIQARSAKKAIKEAAKRVEMAPQSGSMVAVRP